MIRPDMSYISAAKQTLIDNGYAELDVHSLRLTHMYSEQEKEDNRKTFKLLSKDQWERYCVNSRVRNAAKVYRIVSELDIRFAIYQFAENGVEFGEHDLFFWCNHLGNGHGRDYSHVRLSFNDSRTVASREETLSEVTEALQEIGYDDDIDAAIQYCAHYHDGMIADEVQRFCEANVGKMIVHGGRTGKIRKLPNDSYGFFRKGARTHYYSLDRTEIVLRAIEARNAAA